VKVPHKQNDVTRTGVDVIALNANRANVEERGRQVKSLELVRSFRSTHFDLIGIEEDAKSDLLTFLS
jgi:hypothetical protein